MSRMCFAALLRRDEFLNLIGEEDDADLVVVLNGREGERGGNLGEHLTFRLVDGTEVETSRHIDHEDDGQLALLLKHLDERTSETCSDVPVNVAHVVAELVFADLRESHSSSLECRVVLSSKDIVGESACLYFYFPNLTEQF